MLEEHYDVVVVGAGIGGSALAARLAQNGKTVLVLEQQETYKDRTRGETIMPWGVREVVALGLEDVFLGAGGQYAEALVQYDDTTAPEEAEAGAIPYSMLAPDVPGELNVGHPQASQALADHAASTGAAVLHGVSEVAITAGRAPSVEWSDATGSHAVTCRLIVGADGRTSSVRRQLGIGLAQSEATTYGAGLLVKGDEHFSRRNTLGTDNDRIFFAFPRDGYTRLYLFVDASRQGELTGPARAETFLSLYRNPSFPASEPLAASEVIGPCGGSPMTSSWTDAPPVAPGAVLIGDAAGWNDPIIGQGLSIALRDARAVSEVLLASDDWDEASFAPYVAERAERMRRLRIAADMTTALRATFTPEGRARRARWTEARRSDPVMLMQIVCSLTGPESAPAESFTDEAVAHTLAI